MKIHSPYRPLEKAIPKFLKNYRLASMDELKASVARLLSSEYGLSIQSFDYFKPSLCMRITTDIGPYFFKAFDAYTNPVVDDLFDLIDHLRNQKIPIPKIQPTRESNRYTIFQNHPAYLSEVALGEPISSCNKDHTRLSAQLLATIHLAGEHFIHGNNESYVARKPLFAEIREGLDKVWEWLNIDPSVFKIHEFESLSNTYTILKTALCISSHPFSFHRTFIHGDYKPCHIFHECGHVSGIIDFDFAGYGERLCDVASIASSLDHEGSDNPDFENQILFIDEYQKYAQLTDAELKAIPVILLSGNFFRTAALAEWQNRGVHVPNFRIRAAVKDVESALCMMP